MLKGKKILVGICGSIAAYKIVTLVRLLKKEHAEIKIIQTESAKKFIPPLTLSVLSQNPVYSNYFQEDTGEWTNHVALAAWADLMVIAPLSANTLGKMANGICDNLLLATYLSTKCSVMVVPAMDLDMYKHNSTVNNLRKLQNYGNHIIPAQSGELASGLVGVGRMEEPENILEKINSFFKTKKVLIGKKVLITSGPTHEAIDPVRFISNHSSGKMGTALADAFKAYGAEVTFITGPSEHLPEQVKIIPVSSANEMLKQATLYHNSNDIVVFAAAVSDYKPNKIIHHKIKKDGDTLSLKLVKNPDIAEQLGQQKKHQIHIGFALETHEEVENAISKLNKKNFDLIVLNSLNDEGAGFQTNTNKVTFFDRNNLSQRFNLKTKTEVAKDIVKYVVKKLDEKR